MDIWEKFFFMNKSIFHFVATTPQIYSSFDKFNLELSKILYAEGWHSVFIFLDNIFHKPIRIDLKKTKATIVILDSKKNKFKIFIDLFFLYKKFRPQKVHVHFVNYLRVFNLILAYIFRADYYNSFRSMLTPYKKNEYKERKGIVKFLLLRCFLLFVIAASRKSLCNSEAIKTEIKDFSGIHLDNIECLYVGIKDIYQKKSKTELKKLLPEIQFDNQVIIANVGAFEHLKGVETLVRSVDLLKNKFNMNNFILLHIGGNRTDNAESCEYNHYIFNLCEKFKIQSNIYFLGRRNDVYEILPHIDFYVHPSFSEGLSQAVIEACSASLPIVGTYTGGLPEVICDKHNGFLVNIDDENDLAKKMKLLIENKCLRKRMGLNSYNVFKNKFYINRQLIEYITKIGIKNEAI